MNGHEKIKQAIMEAERQESSLTQKRAAASIAEAETTKAWMEVKRVLHHVLGDRDEKGVVYAGKLYRVRQGEQGFNYLQVDQHEAEVIT